MKKQDKHKKNIPNKMKKVYPAPVASTTEPQVTLPVRKPEILAPAGDMTSALAAFAAGADAVYLGLKHFSARMQAENFSVSELAGLTDFAHSEGRRVFVAMNTLLKPHDPAHALRLIRRLTLDVAPDALIVQDLGIIPLAKEAGFTGEIHLSTLSNVTHQSALESAARLGANRVILPRELSLDEVRLLDAACPEGMALELFIHGALCYCVSGRCWWSSYMGGKSGLRGRCVQPCRRVYKQKGREGRFFSSLDLSLDTLVKFLLPLPNLRSWKIEGRRKGPHYVYYVTSAYHLLREEGDDPAARKEAETILSFALGRPGTRSLFTSRKGSSLTEEDDTSPLGKDVSPVGPDGQTSSGLLCGKVGKAAGNKVEFRPRFALLPRDYLRVGYEDEPWHSLLSVPKAVPNGATYTLTVPRGATPKPGTPIFLIDRKEPELMTLLEEWKGNLATHRPVLKSREEDIMALMPRPYAAKREPGRPLDIVVRSSLPHGKEAKTGLRPGTVQGLWLSQKAVGEVSKTLYHRISWWLPPVIWPNEDASWRRIIRAAVRGGARHFVCNAPWQAELFTEYADLALTAGPFCNIANAPAIALLASMGFNAAMISPELGREDILSLPGQSVLPLGLVISGYWPMGVSRHGAEPLKSQEPFSSPKGEEFWLRRYGQNTWLYPAWPLDLTEHLPALQKAGYSTFVHLTEHPPKGVETPKRTSPFNWTNNIL